MHKLQMGQNNLSIILWFLMHNLQMGQNNDCSLQTTLPLPYHITTPLCMSKPSLSTSIIVIMFILTRCPLSRGVPIILIFCPIILFWNSGIIILQHFYPLFFFYAGSSMKWYNLQRICINLYLVNQSEHY